MMYLVDIDVYTTKAKYMEKSINKRNIIKLRHIVLFMISSEHFAVPLYMLLVEVSVDHYK